MKMLTEITNMIYKFASQKKIAAGEQIGKTYYHKGLRH